MIFRRLRVTGRVQNVFFRDWTVEQARALGVDGWVRNRADGSVEILAGGPDEAVAQLARRCEDGPPAARVERVQVEDAEAEPLERFGKRPTA